MAWSSVFFFVLMANIFLFSNANADVNAGEKVELAQLMARVQQYLHKTGLSIAAKNNELIEFYMHELGESLEELEAVEEYEGFKIRTMTKAMLLPAFKALQETDHKDFRAMHSAYLKLIGACNACHKATRHGFIKIKHRDVNPYLQEFE